MSARPSPRFHPEMSVRVTAGADVTSGRFVGRTFLLHGHAEWFNAPALEGKGWWSWAVPAHWNKEIPSLRANEKVYVPEIYLAPEYDGDSAIPWEHSAVVWKPVREIHYFLPDEAYSSVEPAYRYEFMARLLEGSGAKP